MDLQPSYEESHALIIGINSYKNCSPLAYAVSDAESVAEILARKFGFPAELITCLHDEAATKDAILQAFYSFAELQGSENDRIIVFFAGHGITRSSWKGEVGFLIPYDGDTDDLSTLIGWDELTRGARLISAKHVLFVMDACYGGLALTRGAPSGAMRLLNDLLVRYSRQVITAGKADQQVSDFGGPLPGHSIFTGHLLQALEGEASDSSGFITANGVMDYVYRNVGADPDSYQTPHYGHLEGDGDLILQWPEDEIPSIDVQAPMAILLPQRTAPLNSESDDDGMTFLEQVKEYLSESRYRIKLHDLITERTRELVPLVTDERFLTDKPWDEEEFRRRVGAYEESVADLLEVQAIFGHWATPDHFPILSLPSKALARSLSARSGLLVWCDLRWYPIALFAYAVGLSSVAVGNYDALAAYLHTPVRDDSRDESSDLLVALIRGIGETRDVFKTLPGHERHHVAFSEYLHTFFQPLLDDLFLLGVDYESTFDRFEILVALEFAHLTTGDSGRQFWGPPGRFGWKHRRGSDRSPFAQLVQEASEQEDEWPPIQAGLFGSSYKRFFEVASGYAEFLRTLGWY